MRVLVIAAAVCVALLVAVVLTAFVAGLVTKPRKSTAAEVADLLQRFLDGTVDDWEWDDFVCVPIADDNLDAVRIRVAEMPDEFPRPFEHRRAEVMQELIEQLRRRDQ